MNDALNKYLQEKNLYSFMTKTKPVTFPADRDLLKAMLESDLSPENLTCDGELSGAALKRRVAHLRAVEKALA